MSPLRLLLAALLLGALAPDPAVPPATRALPESTGLSLMHRPGPGRADPPLRPNAEMVGDILDLAFALESGRPLSRLGRFEGPVRLTVAGPAPPSLMPDLDALLRRLRVEAGLDVTLARPGAEGPEAAIVIEAVPKASLALAAPQAACFVVPNATSFAEFLRLRGSPLLDWEGITIRRRAAVFVPADAAPQEIRDCLHEELAQALGPLNDLSRLPDSVFNDDNMHSTLTGFDMLVLRVIHALPVGITRQEAAARLPDLLARLNPQGEQDGRPDAGRTAMARPDDDIDRREGLAHYALGRSRAARDPAAAQAAFAAAREHFRRSPLTAIHRAHAEMQLAAYALAAGDPDRVLFLTGEAIPTAEAHGNAALLATLLLLRAEALEAMGRGEEAAALRLDGLAWARYGFGRGEAVDARLREVQALNPWRMARSMAG